jgi:hypothetical protein
MLYSSAFLWFEIHPPNAKTSGPTADTVSTPGVGGSAASPCWACFSSGLASSFVYYRYYIGRSPVVFSGDLRGKHNGNHRTRHMHVVFICVFVV